MRNLTMATCLEEFKDPLASKEARQAAAFLWADLSEEESGIGCTSCMTYKPVNCTNWFMMPHGYRRDHTAELKSKRRKMQEKLDAEEMGRKEGIRDSIGSGCCRIDKRTGEKTCGREFCARAFKKAAEQRMAHVLRKLHERPTAKTNLDVKQLVSTDMVQPKLHHDPRCQTEKGRDQHGHVECLASSILKHMGDKHGFSENEIDAKMQKFGIKVADIIQAQIRHSTSNSDKKKAEYKSDPVKAEAKAEMRRAEAARRSLSTHVEAPPKRKSPRASWMKKSTRKARRLSESEEGKQSKESEGDKEEEDEEPVVGVERLALSPKDLRKRKKVHDEFVRNQTDAAKTIVRAANLAVATTGAQPLTMRGLMEAAWESSLASDGSLIGRAHSIMNTVGRMADKVSDMTRIIQDSRAESTLNAETDRTARKRRELTEKEEEYFRRVDEAAGTQTRGFKVPDHVQESWGWITESVDWVHWYDEAHRVGRVLYQRHEWMQQHAEETGALPVGILPEEHRTGYSFLDINAPPTFFGSLARSFVTGGTRHTPHRNLKEKMGMHDLPRVPPPEGYVAKSLIGSFIDAAVNDEDPIEAAWTALHYNDHNTRTRRLLEVPGWFTSNVKTAVNDYGETLFGPPTGEVPGKVNVPGTDGIDPLRQIGRYVVYDTLMCYLYPPPSVAGGAFGDGTTIKLHFSNRACFPMIPWLPPDPPRFNEFFGFDETFKWSSLEYNNSCDSAAVKALIGPMMGELSAVGFIAAPYGSVLRFAEGIDSIRNLIKTGQSDLSQSQRASALVCSVAQLGGVIWMAILTLFMLAFCVCAPLGSWVCLWSWRMIKLRPCRDAAYERAMNSMDEGYDDVDYASSAAGPSESVIGSFQRRIRGERMGGAARKAGGRTKDKKRGASERQGLLDGPIDLT